MADFTTECELAADGKLACSCGNKDWHEFFYAGGVGPGIIGGCKKCLSIYIHQPDGSWKLQSGPPPRRPPEDSESN